MEGFGCWGFDQDSVHLPSVTMMNFNANLKHGVAGLLYVTAFIITIITTSSAFLQAKSTAEYVQASKARITQYEQQVSLDFA